MDQSVQTFLRASVRLFADAPLSRFRAETRNTLGVALPVGGIRKPFGRREDASRSFRHAYLARGGNFAARLAWFRDVFKDEELARGKS